MKKVWLGVFAALAFGSAACSSSSTSSTTCPAGTISVQVNGATQCVSLDGGLDTGGGDSPGVDSKTDSNKPDIKTDTSGGDTTTPGENTVGKTCSADTECDPLGTGDNVCATNYNPTPVCWGKTCDPGTGTSIVACDNSDGVDRGVCLKTSSGGICLPACKFDDTGAAPTGCQGKDACFVYGWSTKAPITGVGYCFGGCFSDADCGKLKCQTEEGICQSTLKTFAKKPGDACTYKTGAGAVQDCNCFAASATNMGYCTQFCEIGDTAHACPTGLKCSAVLPTKCASGTSIFTKSPSGIAGNCLKPCTADADCKDSTGASLSSTCKDTTDGKFCLPFDPGSGC